MNQGPTHHGQLTAATASHETWSLVGDSEKCADAVWADNVILKHRANHEHLASWRLRVQAMASGLLLQVLLAKHRGSKQEDPHNV